MELELSLTSSPRSQTLLVQLGARECLVAVEKGNVAMSKVGASRQQRIFVDSKHSPFLSWSKSWSAATS